MSLAVLFASFLSPPLYSVAILVLAGVIIAHRGVRGGKPMPDGALGLFAVFLIFAALAVLGPTFNHGRSGHNAEALKFIFAGMAFLVGIMLGTDTTGLKRYLPVYVVVITLVYAVLSVLQAQINQQFPLYPPDNNHSSAMLAVFLPLVVLRMRGSMRLGTLILFAIFAYLTASRALLALTLFSFAMSSGYIRRSRILLVSVGVLALAILFLRGFSLGNFSDQLRLQILHVSLNFAKTRGAHAFNFGEGAFTDFLNIYPIYRRLEIQHAHNLILQIWAAYGIAPLVAFTVFVVGIGIRGWRTRNYLFLASLGAMFAFGMIEALITDVRAFGTIMFGLGYTFSRGQSLAASVSAPLQNPASDLAPRESAATAPA